MLISAAMLRFFTVFFLSALLSLQIYAAYTPPLDRRTDPYFPPSPPSCPICEKDYNNINSCAAASPVLANFSMIIFNPGAFVDVIKCSCVDTFQAAFPQCVDCFIKTGQENVINSNDLPAVVDGMRKICALQSTLLGNVSGVHGYFNSTSTTASIPSPTASTSSSLCLKSCDISMEDTLVIIGVAVVLGFLGM